MIMNDWLHNLPIVWMALLVFGLTALVTGAIYLAVRVLSVGERARSFKAVSPGMLPPLAVLSALFIAFTASQVWTDNDRASAGVDREASALRSVVILAAAFPGESETRLRSLIRSYVGDAVAQEWPMMARRTATLQVIPYSLAEALQLTLALTPSSQGQQTAQRNHHCAGKRIRRSTAAHHHQSFAGQLGQMVMPSLASGVRAARDRHGT
jgi:hypothetical protein